MQRQILFTKEGYKKALKEKKELEKKRPLAVEDLKRAREMGDLSENGYYKAARAKLSSIDAQLRHFTYIIRFAKVKKISLKSIIDLGSRVHLKYEQKDIVYNIVGEHEANPSEKKISHFSPLGKALMNKKVGESVNINSPSGQKTYKITAIK